MWGHICYWPHSLSVSYYNPPHWARGEEWHLFCFLQPSLRCSCISHLSQCLFFTRRHTNCKPCLCLLHSRIQNEGAPPNRVLWQRQRNHAVILETSAWMWHTACFKCSCSTGQKSHMANLCVNGVGNYSPFIGTEEWIIGNSDTAYLSSWLGLSVRCLLNDNLLVNPVIGTNKTLVIFHWKICLKLTSYNWRYVFCYEIL